MKFPERRRVGEKNSTCFFVRFFPFFLHTNAQISVGTFLLKARRARDQSKRSLTQSKESKRIIGGIVERPLTQTV